MTTPRTQNSQKTTKGSKEVVEPQSLTIKIDNKYRSLFSKSVIDILSKGTGTKIVVKGNTVSIFDGNYIRPSAAVVESYMANCYAVLNDAEDYSMDVLDEIALKAVADNERYFKHNRGYISSSAELCTTYKEEKMYARSPGQDDMAECIKIYDLVIVHGSAGSGKTTVAATMAADMLMNNRIDKIIITRPAIEAGSQKLGYLPGDKNEKMDPYVKPIKDALEHVFGKPKFIQLCHEDKIEIVPMPYIRGRSFNSSFIIADEMQNSTTEEMLTLLTRAGLYSKVVCLGDLNQEDKNAKIAGMNGLKAITKAFKDDNRVAIVEMKPLDIQRSWIVEAASSKLSLL